MRIVGEYTTKLQIGLINFLSRRKRIKGEEYRYEPQPPRT